MNFCDGFNWKKAVWHNCQIKMFMHGELFLQYEMKAVSAQVEESCFVYVKPQKIKEHIHGIIPCMLDSWAHPFERLFLLKSSMVYRQVGRWLVYILSASASQCRQSHSTITIPTYLPSQVDADVHINGTFLDSLFVSLSHTSFLIRPLALSLFLSLCSLFNPAKSRFEFVCNKNVEFYRRQGSRERLFRRKIL